MFATMLRRSLLYTILLWFLLQLIVKINCQNTTSRPTPLFLHTATLVDNKLFILGGWNERQAAVGFFYINVSAAFNTQKLIWHNLTDINTVPPHYAAASGVNNNALFIYGGMSNDTINQFYTFNTQSNSWSTLKIAGISDTRKSYLMGVMDNNGKMYLWSGVKVTNNAGIAKLSGLADDMLILDTVNLNSKQGLPGPLVPRISYGAVLLPNNNIIYTGGYDHIRQMELPLRQVYMYDTINDKWDIKTTSGKIPSNRDGFSAVLGLDGQKLIIFGGTSTVEITYLLPGDSLYVLDLNTFGWYTPNVSGNIPPSRSFHKANVIGKYMVVSFGLNYDNSVESDILLLDISNHMNYTWTNHFDPKTDPPVPSNSPDTPDPSKSSTVAYPTNTQLPSSPLNGIVPVIILVTIGSLFSCALAVYGIRRWNINSHRHIQKNTAAIDYF